VNRAWWDFQDEPGTQVKLWTKPLFANWFSMPDEGFRSGGRVGGMLQPPGTYTVTLVIDGEDAASQPLTVLKDPTSEGSLSDIRTQYTLMDEIRADQEGAAAAVNRIELIRKQIADIRTVVDETSDDTDEEFDAASSTLEEQLIEVESSLVQLKTTGGGDGVRWPAMLWGQLNYLRGAVGSADFRPTDQHGEVQVILRQQLRDAEEALEALLETAVQEYNRLVLARGLPPIIT
jgi:DNA-binding transcriptional MerR regulator